MKRRAYQQRVRDEVEKKIKEGYKRILVPLPTGGGKGFMAADLIAGCSAKKNENIFFADQRELVFQISKHLDGMSIPHRKLMAGTINEFSSYEEAVTSSFSIIAAKDTLWSRAFKRKSISLPSARLVQIDECHHIMSRTYLKLLQSPQYENSIHIGWSATPCRADNRCLGSHFETIVKAASYKELQDDGYLVPVKIFAPDRPDLKGMSGTEYSLRELDKRMNKTPLIGSIINEWKKHSQGRSTVVFASSVDHSMHIRDEFRRLLGRNPDGTERAEHVDGKMEQRQRDELMERVRDGSVLVLCNYGVAHTGVDVPRWKYMICARPTKSFALWRQMAGRIQRPFENYSDCIIQDHSDNAHRHGYPDEDVEWSLDEGVKVTDLPRTQRNKPPHDKGADPFECPNCGTPYKGSSCPHCGRVTTFASGKDKEMKKGDLKQLERKKVNRMATRAEKQKFWDEQCLGWAIGTNRKVGAAAHRYKNQFGVWPPSFIQDVPRSSQWKMNAKDFYRDVVAPERKKLREELDNEFEQ